jgi:hypothetical protein
MTGALGEFAIRLTLGSRAIAGLVLRQGAGWMAAGDARQLAGRLLRDLLYGVSPLDPIALGVAVAILVGCATIALLVPFRRATRVDPATAQRALWPERVHALVGQKTEEVYGRDAIVDEAMIREAAVKMNRGAEVRQTGAQRAAQSERPTLDRANR